MNILTRRSLLIGGAGTLAALAGCSGDDGEPTGESETTTTAEQTDAPETTTAESTETTTEQPTELEIEHPVLCAEQPTGYREYTEQPDGTYEPGDVVWLYYEPSTVGTEPAGNGEIRFEYEITLEVTSPDGESLGTIEDSASRTLAEGADLSEVFLFVNFSPPTEFESGTHTLELDVTDTIAGNTARETLEFDVDSGLEYASGEFGIGRFVFTQSEARDYRDYDENPEAEYGPTETVWYYYEIDGFAYEETSNAKTPDLQVTETVTGPEGEIWSEADIPLNNMFDPSTDLDTYYVADRVSPAEEWLPGEYQIQYDVTDRYADESVTETYTFTVVE